MKYLMENPIKGTIGKEKYEMAIHWRNGSFIADEPEKNGGKDLGPDPYTLLLSSLATCTLATLRMYIDRKGWDIENISVQVNLFQNNKDGNTDTIIDRDIHFESTVTPEQRERLLQVAEACPISKILTHKISVRTYTYNGEPQEKELHYTNGEITINWRPELCKHAGRCVSGLPGVFDVNKRPWISTDGATTNKIKEQVDRCPTGALTWKKL